MNQTFREILDAIMPAEESGEQLADLSQLVGDLKGKIDGLKWVMDKLESEAEMLSEKWIKPLAKKKASILAERDRLEEYVKSQMTEHGWTELFGNAWKLKVQNATPSVVMPREPTASDWLVRPDVIKQELFYTWKKVDIAKLLKDGAEVFGGTLKQNKSLRPYPIGAKE